MLNIKTCPYCNTHYTIIRKDGEKADCDFDHFYSKSKYPYLSISFFNLIPCCHICNINKSDRNCDDLINPYQDSFHDKFKFVTNREKMIDFILNGKRKFPENLIKTLPLSGYDKNLEKHNEFFNLEEINKEHTDVVFEIYVKAHAYPETRIKELQGMFDSSLFEENEVKRFILGNYTLPSEINQRPLSKLMQDIAKEAGLFKNKPQKL